jgi:hypothetical protein
MNNYISILIGLLVYLAICFILPAGPYDQFINPRSIMLFFVGPFICGFVTGLFGKATGWKLSIGMQITFNIIFLIYSIIDMASGGIVEFSFLVFFNVAHVGVFSIPSLTLAGLGGLLSTIFKSNLRNYGWRS